MTIDNLLNRVSNTIKVGAVIGIGSLLAGCDAPRSIGVYNHTYSSHKVTIAEIKSHPDKYRQRMIRVEGIFGFDADVNKGDFQYSFILKPKTKEEKPLMCFINDSSDRIATNAGFSIVQQAKEKNEQGIMYTLSLDGVLRGDKSTSYWLDVHRMKELDSNRYVTVGLIPSTESEGTMYVEWPEKKKSKDKKATRENKAEKKEEKKEKKDAKEIEVKSPKSSDNTFDLW